MKLRRASADDVPLLKSWGQNKHVIIATGSDGPVDWGWEEELKRTVPWHETLIAELDGRPIGMLQIIDPHKEESHYWGEIEPSLRAIDVWIGEASDLGKGYGTQMMALALDRCFADDGVTAVVIDPLASNTKAIRFYERLGFRRAERRKFGDDDCYVYRLERGDWERTKGRAMDADVKTFLGLPYRWNVRKAFANIWNKDDDRVFPPKQFGWGWDLNFHALVKKVGLKRSS